MKSVPEGKEAVEKRVAQANARIAVGLCDCAMCEEAARRVRALRDESDDSSDRGRASDGDCVITWGDVTIKFQLTQPNSKTL